MLLHLLRAARVGRHYIDAVRSLRFVEWEESAIRPSSYKTSMPNRYEFNHALGIGVLEVLDADAAKYQVLNLFARDLGSHHRPDA